MPLTRVLSAAQRRMSEPGRLCKAIRDSLMLSLAICFFAGPQAQGQSTESCMPWPLGFVPFDSFYYVSQSNPSGDRLVVGKMSLYKYMILRNQLPAPAFVNQEFCGSLELAPGVFAKAYVPTYA